MKKAQQSGPFQKHASSILSCKFSPDARLVAAAGGGRIPGCDTSIRVWHAVSGKELLICQGHVCGIYDLAFDPKTGILASAGEDYSVILWNLETRDAIFLVGGPPIVKGHVAFSANAPLIAIGETENYDGEASSIYVINLETGKEVFRHTLEGTDAISAMAFSPEGDRLTFAVQDFGGLGDTVIWRYNVSSSEQIWRTELKESTVHDLYDARTGNALVASISREVDSHECQPGVIDLTNGAWEGKYATSGFGLTTALSPAEDLLVCADEAGNIDLYDVPSLKHVKRIAAVGEQAGQRHCSAQFSPDGKRILLGDSTGCITAYDR